MLEQAARAVLVQLTVVQCNDKLTAFLSFPKIYNQLACDVYDMSVLFLL